MKVAVLGLWHLGSVTAACLAEAGHEVLAYDSNLEVTSQFKQGIPPIHEPGLTELIAKGIASEKLKFTANTSDLKDAEIVWVTIDTPVDENDKADVAWVKQEIEKVLPCLTDGTLVLISSQLPVGTTRALLARYSDQHASAQLTFGYSPENLRLGKAIEVFTKPDRVVVGLQVDADKSRVQALLEPFTKNICWMSIESAEMTKHALNAFLAMSVVFINELAGLCEKVGADAREVEKGLKSEQRIGPKAYLHPGTAIGGGTLARDVNFLIQIGAQEQMPTHLFSALLESNQVHKQWSCRRLMDILQDLKHKTIAVLGLTYKVGTDTLRRSTAIELCEWLSNYGSKVLAYDPVVKSLPPHLASIIELKPTIEQALTGADAAVLSTEWPEFNVLTADTLISIMSKPVVIDANGFLTKSLRSDDRIHYYSVGI